MERRGRLFRRPLSSAGAGFVLASLFLLGAPLVSSQTRSGCDSGDVDALRDFADGLQSALPGWNLNDSSSSCCDWPGVTCGPPAVSGARVVGLDLRNMSLRGSVSDSLAGLDQLGRLDLSVNHLHGAVPRQLFRLPLLEHLGLSSNQLAGAIPPDVNLPAIKVFNISCNYFSGDSHPVLGGSVNLTSFDISDNRFSGVIDAAALCSSATGIRVLRLSWNHFSGEFPGGLENCSSLAEFALGSNHIAGTLPDELFEMPSLRLLDVQQNSLSGNLSTRIGELSNLVLLDLSMNRFSGYIPDVFGNLTKLESFSANSNFFIGNLPASLSSSPSLKVLNLNNNSLSGMIDVNCTAMANLSFLDLGSNSFSGAIPSNLPQCAQLKTLNLAKNKLTWEIPNTFKDFASLSDLSLTGNLFSNLSSALQILQHCPNLTNLVLTNNFRGGETMPTDGIQGFRQLQLLVIANCALSGVVPPWLANSPDLEVLDISWNYLSGTIPPFFGTLDKLFYLDLSNNSLTDELPAALTQLNSLRLGANLQNSSNNFPFFIKKNSSEKALRYNQVSNLPSSLILGHNKLVGRILPGFGELAHLHVLDLSWNNLSGNIPEELSGMTNLETMDLSHNSLTGRIPSSLTNLSFLSKFDVAYNNLTGPVPTGGQFSTFLRSDFEGNSGLCGLHSPCASPVPAQQGSKQHGRSAALGIGIGVGVGTSALLLAVAYFVVLRTRSIRCEGTARVVADGDETLDAAGCRIVLLFQNKDSNQELSIDEIVRSTNNFDQACIVGCGGFGLVYRATLRNGRKVAIKRLSGDYFQMEREFQAEVETLSRAQHKNLVLLQGYCRFSNDRLLIYSYMENGSLDHWLHEKPDGRSTLDWAKRVRIARGAARGLDYLHRRCDPHILHRDIKSSNILLDDDFEPHLADFGLARFMLPYTTHVTTDLVGTLGYIPPEYGQSSVATFKGDVYSFGVVLLELLTGRRPVDMCEQKASREVVPWVFEMRKEEREGEVFDPCIRSEQHGGVMRMLEIASLCVSSSPRLRPSSDQLLAWLEEIAVDGMRKE